MRVLCCSFVLILLQACPDSGPPALAPATPPPANVASYLEERLDLASEVILGPTSQQPLARPLEFVFSKPVIPPHLVGLNLDHNPFQFEPVIEGRARWMTCATLRYVPTRPLSPNTLYKGVLHGKALFGEQRKVSDLTFEFRSSKQEILHYNGDFEPSQDGSASVRFKGSLFFAHPVEVAMLLNDLTVTLDTKKLSVEVTRTEETQRITVTGPWLPRTKKDQHLRLSLPSYYTSADHAWEVAFLMPALHTFRLLGGKERSFQDSLERRYDLFFSDPIKAGLDVIGYLSILPQVPVTASTKEKVLTISGNFLPGTDYTLTIDQKLPSIHGHTLSGVASVSMVFENSMPAFTWLSPGVIFPSDNQGKLQGKAINLKQVHLEVWSILPRNYGFFLQDNDLVDRSVQRKGGGYQQRVYADLSRVAQSIHRQVLTLQGEVNRWTRSEWNLESLLQKHGKGMYVLEVKFAQEDLLGTCTNDRYTQRDGQLYFDSSNYARDPCQPYFYYDSGLQQRLLIVSDVALTAKVGERFLDLFATDLLSACPIPDLQLTVFSYLGAELASGRTDRHGYFQVPVKDAAYIVGQNRSGLAMLKLTSGAWRLNTFDVGGAVGSKHGVNAFLYTDRGVHRPGDTIHLSALLRFQSALPAEGQPIALEVTTPRGKVVVAETQPAGPYGHVSFTIPTSLDDPTGTWQAKLSIGDRSFELALPVETVKPNQLKIAIDLPEVVLPSAKDVIGSIKTKYLFGLPAAGLTAKLNLRYRNLPLRFDGYDQYRFDTPARTFSPGTLTVQEGVLDATGGTSFKVPVTAFGSTTGALRAQLKVAVHERGGSLVEQSASTIIHPYGGYVGVGTSDQDRWLLTGQTIMLPVIVLDPHGKPLEGHDLIVKEYVNSQYWWYDYGDDDRKEFRSLPSTTLVGEHQYLSAERPFLHPLTLNGEGRYLVIVTDRNTGHEAGIFLYSTPWSSNQASPEEKEIPFVSINSDKNVYHPGDTATLCFKTPAEGTALLSIEQGAEVLHHRVVALTAHETCQSLPILESHIPNCYVTVSLIQPHGKPQNDLPLRLYGVKQLFVEEATTRLPLTLQVPDQLRPGQRFKVTLHSKAASPVSCTLAIVDEGLLDLTDFTTPDPWKHFFSKLRLGVKTLDSFDTVIGLLLPNMNHYITIGGDFDDSQRRNYAERNETRRFEPVALFEGPFTIAAQSNYAVEFTLPQYIGAVRIMAIGAAGNSYAALEQTVPVKQELMTLLTAPRVARPGDQFKLPVSVFTLQEKVGPVEVALEVTAPFERTSNDTIRLTFDRVEEQDVVFPIRVKAELGAGSIQATAKSATFAATALVKLPVLCPNPPMTEVKDLIVNPGATTVVSPRALGLSGTNHARLVLTRMPEPRLNMHFVSLLQYPYGCLEQILSGAVVQVVAPDMLNFSPYEHTRITANVNAAIAKLDGFLVRDGYSLWPSAASTQEPYHIWASVYTGHFLHVAKEAGYHVPQRQDHHWKTKVRAIAVRKAPLDHRPQTYALFLLALNGEPELGAMNLLRESYLGVLDPLSKHFLATAYHLMNRADIAQTILAHLQTEITDYREMCGTFGSGLRDLALQCYLSVLRKDAPRTRQLLTALLPAMQRQSWYSTQEMAFALLAIAATSRQFQFDHATIPYRIRKGDEPAERHTLAKYRNEVELDAYLGKSITVTNESASPLFLSLQEQGVPLEAVVVAAANGITLQRNFYDEQGRPLTVLQRKQGAAFWLVYSVGNAVGIDLEGVVLASMFPAGWEIENQRFSDAAWPDWMKHFAHAQPTYADIRDDRINWFFDLPAGRKPIVFCVKINPSFRGNFTLPPVSCETMYSPEYFARIPAGRVTVE